MADRKDVQAGQQSYNRSNDSASVNASEISNANMPYGAFQSVNDPRAVPPQYAQVSYQMPYQMPYAPQYSALGGPMVPPVAQVPPVAESSLPILLGTYTPKIDAKGRVALPAKLRAQLGEGFVMARGQERCIYVLPMQEFQRMTLQIQRTSVSNKAARDYLRMFLSAAVDQEPDKQGRILVPAMLREYANLGTDIVVIGVGTRAEIWDRAAWQSYLAEHEQAYADIADDVLPAVI